MLFCLHNRMLHMSKLSKPEVLSLSKWGQGSWAFSSSSLDLTGITVVTFSGLILQICLIHCAASVEALALLGQQPSFTGISRASWHIPLAILQWWQDHLHYNKRSSQGTPESTYFLTHVTRPPAWWWRVGDWVWSPSGPWPSPQTLGSRVSQMSG